MKLKDILSKKSLEEFEPLMSHNPHMQKLDIRYLSAYKEDKHNKTLIYQFKGTRRGFYIFCELDGNNNSLINKTDFPSIPESKKNINGIEYRIDMDNDFELAEKMDLEYASILSKKYNLPYDLVLNCGDIEPFYKRLTNNDIKISGKEIKTLIDDLKFDDIINLFEPQDREYLRSTLCDVNINTDFIEMGGDIHPLVPLAEYISKQQEVELDLPKTPEEAMEYEEKLSKYYDDLER